ncbi:hypothetical protein RDV64_01320 [Acuticoccus sp. MNP-M23]|uniref:hypothetical protein n=1 Tax=Acuticoccus sp. MNP-M23 TaxID=3072793 RepID=UPI00281644ED|nr:hypothetical protein [Acuticoccus sp. MNP-M23]WMS43072.1 hypothetical protein RDV64_01320 [Acuticoccus sp. MNP-M23]
MEFEQIFENFQYNDLQWFIPVLAGLIIIVLGLLAGLIRGMTAGVIVALFFGGLMSLSPTLLTALQPIRGNVDRVGADVARSAAELSTLNNEVVVDLVRVVTTMRTALQGLTPLLEEPAPAPATDGDADPDGTVVAAAPAFDPELGLRFAQSLDDTETRLDAAIDTLSRASTVRAELDASVQTLEAELRSNAR